MDSPRGRIHLMEGLVDGTISLTDTVVEHFDRCLGCMACVSSCPSGVQYDRLIEQTRDYVEQQPPARPASTGSCARGVFAVFPHRRRLRAALALPQAAGARPAAAAEADRAAVALRREWPPRAPRANDGPRVGAARRLRRERRLRRRQRRDGARAAADGLRRRTSRARRAAAARCTRTPAGSRRGSRAPASSSRTLAGVDHDRHQRGRLRLASQGSRRSRTSSTCSELLVEPRAGARAPLPLRGRVPGLVPPPPRAAAPLGAARVARRDPGARAASSRPSRRSAAAAPGSTTSSQAGRRRASSATARRRTCSRPAPDAYASANPGCLVQVTAALRRAGRPTPAFHPIELVDASIRGVAAGELLDGARR